MKRFVWCAALAVLAVGCGGQPTPTAERASTPTRVVVIGTGQLDGALRLGVVPVGAASGDGAELVPGYLERRYPRQRAALARITDVGTRFDPDLERISRLKPDLILLNKAGAGASYDTLAKIAPTVMTRGKGINWKPDFLQLGSALGRGAQARAVLDAYRQRARALAARTATAPPSVSFVRFNAARIRIFGVGSFTGTIAADAGLARPASQRFAGTSADLSEEQLDRADARWIFYGAQAGASSAAVVERGIWRGLSAVESRRAIAVDDDVWYLNAGPTAAELVLGELERRL